MLKFNALYQNQYEHNASHVKEFKQLENLSSAFQDFRLFSNNFLLRSKFYFSYLCNLHQ